MCVKRDHVERTGEGGGGGGGLAGSLKPVFDDLSAQRVPMDAHEPCGAPEIPLRSGERARDESALEFLPGILVPDSLGDHLFNELVELFAHAAFPSQSSVR